MYINTHTCFSLRYGTLRVEALIAEAVEKGVKSLALTDINNTSACMDFVRECRKHDIRPAVGIEFRNGDRLMYICIARNQEGFRELNGFLSAHLHGGAETETDGFSRQSTDFPERPPEFHHAYVIYPFTSRERNPSPGARTGTSQSPKTSPKASPQASPKTSPKTSPNLSGGLVPRPDQLRENEYVAIKPTQLNLLYTSPYRHHQDRLLMHWPVTYQAPVAAQTQTRTHKSAPKSAPGFSLHRLLRAIDKNILLSKQQTTQIAAADEYFLSPGELMAHFRDHPQIITNTLQLLDSCSFDMDFETVKNKKSFTGSRYDDRILLEKLAFDGLRNRYGPQDSTARQRVEHELQVIDKLGFSAYFLITWDFIRYAQAREFFHVGRGSGANSIVAYCMGITDVDPIELDLYFERFLNPHRSSPPDFDIDFSWTDRDEVIDYVFKRYGQQYTSLIATYNTFKGRSIIRELGKVFGLPKTEIDQLVKADGPPDPRDKIPRLIYRYGKRMEGLPNHLGIHPGGILISEEPIHTYSATEVPPKGFPIVQFDMFVAEDVGLFKYDVLSQRGLGHIRSAASLVKENHGTSLNVHNVTAFKKDPKIRELIRSGKTVGCFYIESPAMRQLLQKLNCDNYLSLVAASSIIRPGVARSGMMRTYIERHHNPESYEPLHPKMGELMKETYGVMVYQEDVIKVAHHFAGLDLAEADVLRRAMSGKYRSADHFQAIREKFAQNCRERGYPDAISQEVWRQMESFSGYSFSKAHSASYAVESYQSLFLKAHYPLEFMVGVINNFGGFYRTEIYLHEARMLGGKIKPPCINHSHYLTSLKGDHIWLGFIHLLNLPKKIGEEIVPEREKNGPFRNMYDFARRIPVGLEGLTTLIRIGALRFTGKSKKTLLWEANLHFSKSSKQEQKSVLFQTELTEFSLPNLPDDPVEDAYDEIELLGFPLCGPYAMLSEPFPAERVTADELGKRIGQYVWIVGYLVTTKYVRTVNGKIMYFADFLDTEGRHFDTTHFPQAQERHPLTGTGVYKLYGKVADDFGVPSVEVEFLQRMGYKADPRR